MTAIDILTIIACLFLGYWIVSKLMGSSKTPKAEAKREEEARRTQNESKGRSEGAADFTNAKQQARSNRQKEDELSQEYIINNWHFILGVPQAATLKQIREAYRSKIGQYHPDKVAKMGDEIRAVAERKSKQINAAYELATKIKS